MLGFFKSQSAGAFEQVGPKQRALCKLLHAQVFSIAEAAERGDELMGRAELTGMMATCMELAETFDTTPSFLTRQALIEKQLRS